MVDEVITLANFRDQWANYADKFELVWFDSLNGKIYYLKRAGAVLFGQTGGAQYGASSDSVTVAAINQFVVVRIRNPITSGLRVVLNRIVVTSLEARQFRIMTATLPQPTNRTTPIASITKALDNATAAQAIVSRDNNAGSFAISGYNNNSHIEQLQALAVRDYLTSGWEIQPGFAIDIAVGDTTDTAAEVATIALEWSEL